MDNLICLDLWELLSSRLAICIYVIILLIIVIVIIIALMIDFTDDNNTVIVDGKAMPTTISKKDKKNGDTRFPMLKSLDDAPHIDPLYNDSCSLKDICLSFQGYASEYLGLKYSLSDIRKFVAGMSVTKIFIIQGMSGTGKTSLAYAFGEFMENSATVVPIQPMWKERTDLLGYYNEFTKKFNESTLLYKMYEADLTNSVYITVLDEVNIARIEYYFAEFLSLLELPDENKRYIDVVTDSWKSDPKLLRKGKLKLPPNMWFIGTANNDDSTFSISDKVYDRAIIIDLESRAAEVEVIKAEPIRVSYEHLNKLFKVARLEYEIRELNIRRLQKLDKYLVDTFQVSFGNRILKQIREYVPVYLACGGDEIDAIDDILASKILRKLEGKNPVYIRSQSERLIDELDNLFGEGKMKQSIKLIRKLTNSIS